MSKRLLLIASAILSIAFSLIYAPHAPALGDVRAARAVTQQRTRDCVSVREPLPGPLYGVTVTGVEHLEDIKIALNDVKEVRKPITRVVFDPSDNATKYEESLVNYKNAVAGICDLQVPDAGCQLSEVMGLLADSSAMYKYVGDGADRPGYQSLGRRAADFMDRMGASTQVWEIGNEVNGEWTGWKKDAWRKKSVKVENMTDMRGRVAREVVSAYRVVSCRGGLTALTLYYNDDGKGHHCWPDDTKENAQGKQIMYGEEYGMLKWAKENIPPDVREGLKYVLISYYENEGDCPGLNQDAATWYDTFKALAALFPHAKLGFGEVGFKDHRDDNTGTLKDCYSGPGLYVAKYYAAIDRQIKEEIARRAARGEPAPDFVGGYFYWYFYQDMTAKNAPARLALKDALR